MPIRRALTLAIAALTAFSMVLRADQHPVTARGFDIGRPYQMNGIDNVNLFNGNVTVTLPIGQRYHVNGKLDYGLTLVYSGNVWDTVVMDTATCGSSNPITRTYPNRLSNAGLGWLLSLGRLFPPNRYPLLESPEWTYETPDGGLHQFRSVLHGSSDSTDLAHRYTRDGSYLRLTIGETEHTVAFPDGTSQVFREVSPVSNGIWPDVAGTEKWRLRSIADGLGNTVTIEYSSTPAYPEIWKITDGTRTQMVYFVAPPSTSEYDVLLDHVVLTTFGSTTGEWKANYEFVSLRAGATNSQCNGQPAPAYSNIPLLTSVTMPLVDGVSQSYSMLTPGSVPPSPYYFVNSTSVSPFNGHLKGLQLPTKGWLEWDYEYFIYSLPSTEDGRPTKSLAVTKRRMMAADRTPAHTSEWTYQRTGSRRRSCVNPNTMEREFARSEQLVASVTSPEQVTSVHYFSTYNSLHNPGGCSIFASPFHDFDYALPLTRGVTPQSVGGMALYLSREIFTGTVSSLATGPDEGDPNAPFSYRVSGGTLVRSEWALHDWDGDSLEGVAAYNSRETARATYFEDDPNCSAATCYAAIKRYRFDGAGHFRQSSSEGNFGPSDFKTSFTAFPDVNLTGTTWLLNTFTERCAVQESKARNSEVTACSGLLTPPQGGTILSGPLTEQFCFDTRGFLTRRRMLKGLDDNGNSITARRADDVIARYSDTAGNLTAEDYYGGDNQAIGTGDCSMALPSSPTYSIAHTYSNGALATSRYVATTSHPTDPVFKSVDNTIDGNTGLVSFSRDVAERQTSYTYDKLGRLRQVARPAEAAIDYTYTEATETTFPQATAKQISATAGSTTQERTVQSTFIFDNFGRVSEEQRVMPAGTSKRQMLYTGSGWTERVSEWEASPSHFTVFSEFDAFGRARKIEASDSTPTAPKVTTIAYFGSREVDRTVSVGTQIAVPTGLTNQKTKEFYDALGRLNKVEEPGPTSSTTNSITTYSYDAADRLQSVSMVADGVTQPRTFTYDGRGFLTQETHPENGATSYGGFDARGHAGKKLVGSTDSAFDLRYEYDAAERLTRVSHPPTRASQTSDTVKTFTFATANAGVDYKLGKLQSATRRNASPLGIIDVTETYAYTDTAGRLKNKSTSINGPSGLLQSYSQTYSYNDLGLLSQTDYPTCPEITRPCGTSASMVTSVAPTYQNGLLKTVPGFATSVAYDINGMVSQIDHPGSVSDVITGDASKMPRPTRIQFNSYDLCTRPSIAQQPAPETQIQANGSTTLSVAATGGSTGPLSYQWFKDGSTTPLGGDCTGASCPTGPLTATATYRARIINSCGKIDSNIATVIVCGTPAINAQPQSKTISSGESVLLSVGASGCTPLTYQWYRGNRSVTNSPVNGATSSSFNTGPLTATARYWVRVTYSGNSVDSETAILTLPLGIPVNVSAVHLGGNVIQVTWGPPGGAVPDHYVVTRESAGVVQTFEVWGTVKNDDSNSGLVAGKSYLYRVRAVDEWNGSASGESPRDLATTMTFAAVQSGAPILFSHFDQVLGAINAVRGAASPPLAVLSWSQALAEAGYPGEPAPQQYGPIKSRHVLALRNRMDNALQALGLATPAYTDDLSTPTRIKAVHITQLQGRPQ